MLKSLYEFEKCDRTIYDSIHEYCLTEKVNEEYFRSSLSKNWLGGKRMKKYIIIAAMMLSIVALMLSIIALRISYSQNEARKSEYIIIYGSEALGLSKDFHLNGKANI